jgi:hypothetical protein
VAALVTQITIEQEHQFRLWSTDPEAFFRDAVKIEDPKKNVVPFDFDERPYQRDCLERFLSNQLAVVLKARQIGLTTVACGLALWKLLFFENRFILVLSKNDEDAKKFLRRIRMMYQRLPDWVKLRAPKVLGKWGKHEAEFSNGSVIYSATSASDHGRGDTPSDVFLDEVGKMKNQDDSWSALYPAVDAGGNLWMFGTAEGYRDWFHLKWLEWSEDPEVESIFYPWMAVPGRDESWAIRARRRLGEVLFRREFPATPEEAFQSSGNTVFSIEVLDEIETWADARFAIERADNGSFRLVREVSDADEFGLFLFEHPEPGAKYLTSADPAEGLVDSDVSVIQVLKWRHGAIDQVAVYRGKTDPEALADLNHQIAIIYNRATVLVERNNHGGTMLKRLARLRTPNVVRGTGNRPGVVTSKATKGTDIALTRNALAEGHLSVRDERTLQELYGFQEKRTKAGNVIYEGNEHDDHVDALCKGAGYALVHAPLEQPAAEDSVPEEVLPQFSLDGLLLAGRRLTRSGPI